MEAFIFHVFGLEKRFSTASSYEDSLKALIKFRKSSRGKDDLALIKTLYTIKEDKMIPLDEFRDLDMEIKAIDYGFAKDFKAYLSNRYKSKNTPAIYLRSLQAIINDAGKTFDDLRYHKPLSNIKKKTHANAPAPLDLTDIHKIRTLKLVPHTPIWDNRNYLLFMFNNMGMNFFDMAILKRFQFTEGRIKYFRKKTHYEGDYFSVLQNGESLEIINYYLNEQEDDEYLFPIIPPSTSTERLHRVNNAKVKTFNNYASVLPNWQVSKRRLLPIRLGTHGLSDWI